MTDSQSGAQSVDIAHPAHNPFDLPRAKNRQGLGAAVALAVGLHGILGFYLWQWRFQAHYQEFSDEKTDAQLIKPPPLNIAPVPKPPPPQPPVVAAPAPPPPRATVITAPDWSRKPDAEDMARYYPDRAQRMGVNGHATIKCTVTASGSLTNCQVVSEAPDGQEFGSAALKLSHLFKMRPMAKDGQAVSGGVVSIPLSFQVPSE